MLSAILDKKTLPEMSAVGDWTGRARLSFELPTEGKEDVITFVVVITKTQLGRDKRHVREYRKRNLFIVVFSSAPNNDRAICTGLVKL